MLAAMLVPGILFIRVWVRQGDWPALPPSAQSFTLGDALVVLWAVAVLYLALFVVWTVLRLVRRSYSRCQLARPRGGMLKRRPRRSHGWLTARLLRRRV